jgi:predicted nucleic acid-binding protein
VTSKSADYVLDSFALLAYLESEPGAARVQELLRRAEQQQARIFLSVINYGEAVYVIEREKGLHAAQSAIAEVDQLPITVVDAQRKLTFAAAHLKASYPIAYADAFALALAQEQQATLVTGDPEFRKAAAVVQIEWLKRAP